MSKIDENQLSGSFVDIYYYIYSLTLFFAGVKDFLI